MTEKELAEFLAHDEMFDSRGHAWILYGLARAQARSMGAIRALEIGARTGSTTIPLLAGLTAGHPDARLVSVDNGTDVLAGALDICRSRVERYGFASNWELVVADSIAYTPPEPLHLVFIDGGHGYAVVLSDWQRCGAHLAQHGLMALHDTETYPDCRRLALEIEADPAWASVTLPFYNGLTLARRAGDRANGNHFAYTETVKW